MLVFGLNASRSLAEKISIELGCKLGDHEEREFEDREHKARPLVSVRSQDVFVVQSLHGDENGRRTISYVVCCFSSLP